MAAEQDPVTIEKCVAAIKVLKNAPRQIDKLEDAYMNKKFDYSIRGSTGMVSPPSWDVNSFVEIEEYEWLLVQLGRPL